MRTSENNGDVVETSCRPTLARVQPERPTLRPMCSGIFVYVVLRKSYVVKTNKFYKNRVLNTKLFLVVSSRYIISHNAYVNIQV